MYLVCLCVKTYRINSIKTVGWYYVTIWFKKLSCPLKIYLYHQASISQYYSLKKTKKNLQLLCLHTAKYYPAQATVSILQCNHKLLTVSQLRHLVSLVRIPWKISCTHVGSGWGVGASLFPIFGFVLLWCRSAAKENNLYFILSQFCTTHITYLRCFKSIISLYKQI